MKCDQFHQAAAYKKPILIFFIHIRFIIHPVFNNAIKSNSFHLHFTLNVDCSFWIHSFVWIVEIFNSLEAVDSHFDECRSFQLIDFLSVAHLNPPRSPENLDKSLTILDDFFRNRDNPVE